MKTPFLLLCAFQALVVSSPDLMRAAETPSDVVFDWFEYSGRDPVSAVPPPAGSYRNPILAGFYPDPSICRVGKDYYLINSSFAWFPGIPIFHSRDLVHWTQLGHVLDRPTQLKLDGLGVSRGVFAPAISHHAGVFYVVNTLVDAGGNFFVTATDPAGPWSDPVWLPEIDGIDPSFFFDDDGRAYIVNNGPPPGNQPLYAGHRAIWIQEFDAGRQKLTGPRAIIVNGGTDLSRHPIWIEGPHLFKKDGWYYLICAEGGTGEDHSEVVFRSRAVRGPYVPWDQNPILTQRTRPAGRLNPVTCTGHADFVETPDGAWWAVFLGCRPYERDFYNTGRETFLLPVSWTDGWPVILASGETVPTIGPAPRLPPSPAPAVPLNGNFTWRDDFTSATLAPVWNFLRGPVTGWLSLTEPPGDLTLHPRADTLTGFGRPAFVARRQQHAHFTATTALRLPVAPGVSAGLVAFQNETHHFFLGVRRHGAGIEVFLERAAGPVNGAVPPPIAPADLPSPAPDLMELRITGDGSTYSFSYARRAGEWHVLKQNEDSTILSTQTAGGFVGTMLGLYARQDPFFTAWPERGTSPQEVGRRVAQRFLASPHALWLERGTLSYSEVCVWYGALTFAQLTDNAELSTRLVERLETLLAREPQLIPPADHVDNSVFGVIPLEAYRQTQTTRFRALGLAFADIQWDHPTADGLTSQTRFWIDDMFMITVLQTQAYRATGETKYLDRTAREMVFYLDRLQQPNGLFFHTPDTPFFWGRGNGWMAAGMTELLRALPETHPARPRILAGYRRMMATLLEYQGADGLWRQLVDHPEAWGETSCSGMFTFALITGVRNGWLEPERYGPAARNGWLALVRHVDERGSINEVCVGTPAMNDLHYYLDRPRAVGDFHGQAPILWCAAALLR